MTDLERALALRVRKPNPSIIRGYDDLQFAKDEAIVIAAEFAAIRAAERAACAAIAREGCQIGDSDVLREGEARRIYERILARGEVTR